MTRTLKNKVQKFDDETLAMEPRVSSNVGISASSWEFMNSFSTEDIGAINVISDDFSCEDFSSSRWN